MGETFSVEILLIIICRIIAVLLDALSLFMLARAFLPLFRLDENSRLADFLFSATEPFILPVRFVLYKLNLFADSMIDWGFSIAYILIIFIRMALPVV